MNLRLSPTSLWVPLFLLLSLVPACSREEKSHAKQTEADLNRHSGPGSGQVLGEVIDSSKVTAKPVGVPDPDAMGFVLTPDLAHDAVDFTFGIAGLDLGGITAETAVSVSRGILNGAGAPLSEKQKEVFSTLCRDIGVSSSPAAYVPAQSVKKGERLYLMWRSYYSSLAKSHLYSILVGGGAGIECLLTLNLGGIDLNIGFDPSAPDITRLGGSAKLESAVRQGLMLPRISGIVKPTEPNAYVPLVDEANIVLRIQPVDSSKLTIRTLKGSVTNDCALATEGGKTHVANPYALNEINYEVTTSLDISVLFPIAKKTGGRYLNECQAIRFKGVGKNLLMTLSCGQYQAIKDQGVEAACAWDLVASNNKDPENTVTFPIQMSKLAYKEVDLKKANEAIQLFPKSSANPVRNGQVRLSGFTANQTPGFEDLFDLWLAIDEEGYYRDFSGQVKKIEYSIMNGCTEGAGAYTPYGGDTIYWCSQGGMKESEVANRYNDPQMFVYRTMLAYHESRHSKNLRHDRESPSYKPCEGTAYAGYLAYLIVTQCDYDYCKVMRDGAIVDYKLELNYDYQGDTTGRKSQGDCKIWSNAMGISGGGF